jgi:hypothetical protein
MFEQKKKALDLSASVETDTDSILEKALKLPDSPFS